MRHPRDFFKPLAMGAPDPVMEIPFTPSRMIHFFDPSNEKMAAKLPEIAKQSVKSGGAASFQGFQLFECRAGLLYVLSAHIRTK